MKTRNKLYDKSRLRLLCLLTALLGLFGAGQTWAQTQPTGAGTKENPYKISTADELRWFAGLVNGTLTDGTAQNTAAWAALTTNIDLGAADWTPIGSESNRYTGTFDGAGHTIRNMRVDNSNADYQGFVGYLGSGGAIQNLTLDEGCSVTGSDNVGGICAYNRGTIQNCSNSGSVSGSWYVGGICGYNNYGTVTYCHNTGSISCTKKRVGGICGSSFGTITYCYNTGSISGGSEGGGICGQNGSLEGIRYCYSTGQMAGSKQGGICGYNDGGTITNCYCCSETSVHTISTSYGTCTVENVKRLEGNAFASGEVAYLLNGSNPGEDNVWRQNLDNGEIVDQLPVLDNTHGIVYLISMDCSGRPSETSRYTNDEEAASGPGEHTFGDDGFCTVCGGYEPAEKNENGSYEISNVGQLFWFAALVNGDNTYAVFDSQDAAASATLTTDIIIPNGRKWTPIGNTDNNHYTGAFDGQGHAIENLVVESFGFASRGFVGCLGSAGKIQNLALKNCSVAAGESNAGGLCGWNQGTIINCSCTGTVSGATAGGLCGQNSEGGTVTNCWSNVAVTGSPYVGGFCAINYLATVTNCYSTGTVTCTSSSNTVGGFCGYNSDGGISNCYWLDVAYSGNGIGYGTQTGAVVKTADQFMSGEVCWLLQNGQDAQAWGQTLDTDDYPVLTTDEAMHVYAAKLYNGSADKVSELYDNNASGFSNSGEPNALLVIEDAATAPAGTNVVVKSGDAYTCANLVLTDGADFYTPVAFTAAQATYSRLLAEGTQWGTVALPFDATSVTGAELFRVARQEGDALYVDETGGMAGGEPLVFRANAEVAKVDFTGANVTVRATTDAATGSTVLKGTSQTVSPLTEGAYFIYGDQFYRVASGSQVGMKAFRAYIPATAGASTRSAGAASQLRIVFNASETTRTAHEGK
ncbi:GLUG motif-containing protein [uncultured Bacteroides sp.]|uniref:GLUG motif-containing protein n=1 Tax=uncultured Bacteroides sp. TaxID=162156 RepID=UPI00261DF2A8|nr:GLUG motif-containing protein [uncultured Bacteroides sp.]